MKKNFIIGKIREDSIKVYTNRTLCGDLSFPLLHFSLSALSFFTQQKPQHNSAKKACNKRSFMRLLQRARVGYAS